MSKVTSARAWRGAALLFWLCTLTVTGVRPVLAGVTATVHDFAPTGPYQNAGVSRGGSCSSCHIPHSAQEPDRIWSRKLTGPGQETAFYTQTLPLRPDYLPGATLLCYDCHDDALSSADKDPPAAGWNSGHKPQDVALGTDPPGLGGTVVGYYEKANGDLPNVGPAPPIDGSPTGGHYWKTEPNGISQQGDKIACSLCHEPHKVDTGTNEAFFRQFTWNGSARIDLNALNGYGTDLKKSPAARNGTGTGRQMCGTCHGYSDQGNQQILYLVTVPKPPSGVVEHLRDDSIGATPCTVCHPHNRAAGCNDCHGYPPMKPGVAFNRLTEPYGESYPGGAGAHRRHKDALAAIGSTIFACEICHGPEPGRITTTWHMEGANGTTVLPANVDIMGQTLYWGAVSGYVGTATGAAAPQTGYAFTAKGSPERRCYGLTCHGGPPNAVPDLDALNWGDKMVDDTNGANAGNWIAADSPKICKWCHDRTPARIGTGPTAPYAPNVLGTDDGGATGVWTTGTWGADVSGHGKAAGFYDDNALNTAGPTIAANKTCTVCHDARYTNLAIPPKPLPYVPNTALKVHFDRAYETSSSEKRLRDTINGLPVDQSTPATAANTVCNACHQNDASGTAPEGTEVGTHENSPVDGYVPLEAQFSRACRQCHEVHGSNWNGASRNLHMAGKWLDSPGVGTRGTVDAGEVAYVDSSDSSPTPPTDITTGDLRVTFTANTGAGSYDAGNNEGFVPPRSVCVVCHQSLVNNHNQVGDSVVRNIGHNPVGGDCIQCHEHGKGKGFRYGGCFSCHGTNDTEPLQPGAIRRQYWPDGAAVNPLYNYADNQAGDHLKHVTAVAAQIFGETPAQLVTDNTAQNPGIISYVKQVQVCWFCHFDPGGPLHSNNDATAPSGANRVDVLQSAGARDYFGMFKTATGDFLQYGGRTRYTRSTLIPPREIIPTGGDTTGGAYGFVTGSCANLVCHNQNATPVGGWNTPPDWNPTGPPENKDCSNTTCHAPGTYTERHLMHVDDGTNTHKNYACTECHANNYSAVAPYGLGHGNGAVDMNGTGAPPGAWNNPGTLELAAGLGNGYYNKDGVAGATAGDSAFAYKNGVYNITCNLIYCHGGDNAAWGGSFIAPLWNNTDSAYCGSCHDGNATGPLPAGDSSVIATNNHTAHLSAAQGPRFADPTGIAGPTATTATSCLGTATIGCHSNYLITTATHVNGTTEFANIVTTTAPVSALGTTVPAAAPDATSTDRCNRCHSTLSVTVNMPGPTTATGVGTVLAKTNWATGAYTLPCLTCHNAAATAGTIYADGTGAVKAADMLGDDTNYGAEIRGHNRSLAAGNYPISSNVAAAKVCISCHNAAATHITGANDTTYAGNRMLATINGIPATTTSESCNNCHAVTTGTPAAKHTVNMHGNTGFPTSPPTRLEGAFPAASGTYAMECSYCHEPHGNTANGTGYNIYMVPSTITVPTPTAVLSRSGVRLEARSGNFSFNDRQGTDTDDLCEVCHTAPGNALVWNTIQSGYHESPAYPDQDRLGEDCSLCHVHSRDNSVLTVDGLMPVPCNACHTYPAQTSAGTPHLLSTPHDKHVGRPSDQVAIPNKAFICNACHFQSSHNDLGVSVGAPWVGLTDAMIQVRFMNPAAVPAPPQSSGPWNPAAWAGTDTVDRTKDSPSYSAGKVCSNLYCHGDDPANFPAADAGTNTSPTWVVGGAPCGSCHKYTAATPPGNLSHPKHAGSAAGEYSIGCEVCHYTTTTDGTTIVNMVPHVNHSANVVFSALADVRVDATSAYTGNGAVGAGYGACNFTYCHSNGTDLSAPYDTAATAAPEQTLIWNAATGSTCWSCHGNAAALPPVARPKYPDGTPKANKHAIHNGTDADPLTSRNTNGYSCQVCHYATTHDNGATIFTTGVHVNRQYEVVPEDASPALHYFGAYTWALPGGSCAAVNCHAASGIESVSWNLAGLILCDSCHARAAGNPAASDVNNFAWDGTTQSKISNAASNGEYDTYGHGKTGVSQSCAACHDSNVGHDRTMGGANLYRLRTFTGDQIAYCNTLCHTTQVRTHDPAEMLAAGIAPNRTPWPAPWNTPTTSPRCVNCHDPHGDQATGQATGNFKMIQRELYDKNPFRLNAAAPAAPAEQPNLLFFDATPPSVDTAPFIVATPPYASYADSGNFSSLCQECHEAATMVSFHDNLGGGTTLGVNHPGVGTTTNCMDCHRHDAGFAPSGCEGCHNDLSSYPLAPRVMGPGTSKNGVGSTPKPYDDGAWGYNVNGHGANGTAPNTPKYVDPNDGSTSPYLTPNAACTDCHDISQPASGNGRHLNGILNSVDLKQNPSANTAHLRTDGTYPFIISSGGNAWDVQIAFDRACWLRCHQPNSNITDMRHAKAEGVAANNVNNVPNAVRFGDKGTIADGESIALPIDSALTTLASTAGDDFVPCISCHNPHGTATIQPGKNTNRMVPDTWEGASATFCKVCH